MYPTPFHAVPEALVPALEERGFSSLTTVQEAVLRDEFRQRDLRVSSQTGSGKTVAIGFALAPHLMQPDDELAAELEDPGPRHERPWPRVLLIAPTRELAGQLGKELEWLYRPLDARIVVVTGGTNVGLDLRAFKRRPDVLIGTPGRLLDHVSRGSIDLGHVRAVVLDEADEMLDMGFKEELEGILETTPPERRTHMVSATFPKEVLSLAKRYQRDAITVQGSSIREANQDITHIAHDLRVSDKLDAAVNILLAHPGERTLVFVRTRAMCTQLAGDLASLGFRAAPLSGEMSQRDRTATLEAFRGGRVQVLVATDVAARGLDINNVLRVLHYDLPENAETLTHRSGRTGRAGAKGESVMFIPPGGRRRVESLLRRSRIEPTWQPVPGPEEILATAKQGLVLKVKERLEHAVEAASDEEGINPALPPDHPVRLAMELLEECDPAYLVAELLSRNSLTGVCQPRTIRPLKVPASREHKHQQRDPEDRRRRDDREWQTFYISWGSSRGADPRRLLALVCRRGDIKGHSVGAIRIFDHNATVDVDMKVAEQFERKATQPDPRDPRIKIRRWISEGSDDRGSFKKRKSPHRDRNKSKPEKSRPFKSKGKKIKGKVRNKGGFRKTARSEE